MPRMVCTKCHKFLHPKRNGVVVEEGMPADHTLQSWVPYKLWMADLWECRTCGFEIVAGFAPDAFLHHFMPEYKRWKASRTPYVFVEDCL